MWFCTQKSLLAELGGPNGIPGIKPKWKEYKASAFPAVLSLQSPQHFSVRYLLCISFNVSALFCLGATVSSPRGILSGLLTEVLGFQGEPGIKLGGPTCLT